MPMTPDAKRALSTAIRSLRARLLEDLREETKRVYRLTVRLRDAGLDEARRTQRGRLERWIAEQLRAQEAVPTKSKHARSEDDFRREVEKQAASTLVNRLVMLRLMEAPGPNGQPLRAPAVVTGGWESRGYQDFRQLAPALVRGDDTEGYAFLLQLVFEDLATELPGLFGPAGIADLIPIPAATLRHVVDVLDDLELASCWTDDMTLGWVYQYWNDPEREELDKKLHSGAKLEAHEIASKTQMFTERYIVDWLLQNSLGPMWLAMCRKHGWTPEVDVPGPDGKSVLQRLEERRVDWRAKRDSGEVALTELMPLYGEVEQRWAYYVPQPIPDDAVTQAPESIRELKILDPAVGSGHFLVVAMDLLVALYREEARHRGMANRPEWSDRAIVERILSHNLHGIDLDPRAVQIAAAALWLKAHQYSSDVRPERLNLVASNLRLASLPDDDPALVELRLGVEQETGIPGTLTDTIVHALRGADYLGSLLKVDRAVDDAIEAHEEAIGPRFVPQQREMFDGAAPQQAEIVFEAASARQSLVDRLETFLAHHTSGDDLGLRLRGEQLAVGVRFVRMVREGTYDLVVANPPYQGTSKMADARYVESQYPLGKADLYAAFLLRGLQLTREGGVSALLTMRNWMFIKQFAGLRKHLLERFDLRTLGDFAIGAFDEVPNDILSVTASVFHRIPARSDRNVAQQPTPPDDRSYDRERARRKRAATICQVGRHEFDPSALSAVPDWPLVYWWDAKMILDYQSAPLFGTVAPARKGLCTGDDVRFLRQAWEVLGRATPHDFPAARETWVPTVHGAKGATWFEPLRLAINWEWHGLAQQVFGEVSGGVAVRNPLYYFQRGIAFSMIGSAFGARIHRFHSIFGDKGSSVFPSDPAVAVCAMNSSRARAILQSLNPSISFQVGDVNRLPIFAIEGSDLILAALERVFAAHESCREPSVEFLKPGPSSWSQAQAWAQTAVDRPNGMALPVFPSDRDPEPPTDHVSYALGVALGRFGPNAEGILDSESDLTHALPAGILLLDGTLGGEDNRDSLGHVASSPLLEAWEKYRSVIGTTRNSLREWLALDFFKDVHKGMYENRPIHWPLSSSSKTFVAWVNIHRFNGQTLRILLADHLHPTLSRIDGELTDLRIAREGADKKAARVAEKRYDKVLKAREELQSFIANVEQCADRGAPPTDATCPAREQDARYAPDLDDGVMINSAALWPLLEPQWKDPKKWWKQLSEAKDRKDYDWSHLAMRYWPKRVDEKCQNDPSLGVAHGCFWRYHPERAWAWELRLQEEIGPEFRIDELPYLPGGRDIGDPGSGSHRDAWLRDHPQEALAAVEKEFVRRMRRRKNGSLMSGMRILERGLWSAIPDEVWDMELRLSEKQGSEFRLVAPDEAAARANYESLHPDRVQSRAGLLASLGPRDHWFGDADEGDDNDDENTQNAGDEDDVEVES